MKQNKPRFVERQCLGENCRIEKKSKIKAGLGAADGPYKFFTSSPVQSKFYSEALFIGPALIFGTGGMPSIHYCEEPFATSTDCLVYKAKDANLSLEAIYRYLKANMYLLEAEFKGAGLKHISRKCIDKIEVPILNRKDFEVDRRPFLLVEDNIACCKNIQTKLDELVKSRFVEMFGDGRNFEQCEMSNLVSSIVSGTNVSGNQRPIEPGEYAVLKISAVTKGWFKSNEYKVVDDVSSIKMIHPRKGDLLFSRANTSEMVGATAIVDDDYENLFLPDKLWRLDPASDVDVVFLKQVLSSEKVRAEMSKVSTGTSGSMQNISMAKFRKLRAYKPPLSTQKEFASFVSEVDKLKYDGLSDICPIGVKCMVKLD